MLRNNGLSVDDREAGLPHNLSLDSAETDPGARAAEMAERIGNCLCR
jgi:hypothetical protein